MHGFADISVIAWSVLGAACLMTMAIMVRGWLSFASRPSTQLSAKPKISLADMNDQEARLYALIREADRAASRLEKAIAAASSSPSHVKPFASEPVQPMVDENTLGMQLLRNRSITSHTRPRHNDIYMLADEGHSLTEIARHLTVPIGEVELILSLRSNRNDRVE